MLKLLDKINRLLGNQVPTTEGELLFREYLHSVGYGCDFSFEAAYKGRKKIIDFRLALPDTPLCFLDIKDIEPIDVTNHVGAYDPYPPIRKKIEEGREKFKEYKGYPCAVVLYNRGHMLTSIEEPMTVLGSMYGDAGITFPVGPSGAGGPAKSTFLGRGKMIRPNWKQAQNTSISALVSLRQINIGGRRLERYVAERDELKKDPERILELTSEIVGFDIGERRLGVVVWENKFSTKQFPDIFRGPYDERWTAEANAQVHSFIGPGLDGVY